MVNHSSEHLAQLKAFDDTKRGVKGLVDDGISTLPSIFIHPQSPSLSNNNPTLPTSCTKLTIPIIDLTGIEDGTKRNDVIKQIQSASQSGGFFQVVNHGVPISLMEEMLGGVKGFFDQDEEVRKGYYSRDYQNARFSYNTNFDLFTAPAANWRDTLFCAVAPPPNPGDLPDFCRETIMEYSKQVMKLGKLLFELLSEGLGMKPERLDELGCSEGVFLLGHYYPACPQPELAIGTAQHADDDFMTILLQDQIGGLQVLQQDQWVDVPPTPGAFVVNIGDLLQVMSNDKLKSSEHRVLVNKVGPRISVACFFSPQFNPTSENRVYMPLQVLISESDPPKYRETTTTEYMAHYFSKGLDGKSALDHFRL